MTQFTITLVVTEPTNDQVGALTTAVALLQQAIRDGVESVAFLTVEESN